MLRVEILIVSAEFSSINKYEIVINFIANKKTWLSSKLNSKQG